MKEILKKALKPPPFCDKMAEHEGVVGTDCVMRSTYWSNPGLILNGETYLQIQVGLVFLCKCTVAALPFLRSKPQKKE